jgi:hypothetical protein
MHGYRGSHQDDHSSFGEPGVWKGDLMISGSQCQARVLLDVGSAIEQREDMQQPAQRKQPPPPPPEVANRRAARRQQIQVRVDVLPLGDPGRRVQPGTTRSGHSVDLNEHGMLCSGVGYLPLGAVVRLFVRLPDLPEPVACHARVIRCDVLSRPSYGLRYIDLRPDDAQRLRTLTDGARSRRTTPAPSWMYRFDA